MDCLICFDETSDMKTSCNHSFHQSCLDIWLKEHNTCPYCRFEIMPEIMYESESESNSDSASDSDSDSDSEANYEDTYFENIEENPKEELESWQEGFELITFKNDDSYDSMEFFYKCYENIVHLSHIIAL